MLSTVGASGNNGVLFHYTNSVAARGIMSCQCILLTPELDSHPDGIVRPNAAYATDIPPWVNMAVNALLRQLYPDTTGKVASDFVALSKIGWARLVGPEWIKTRPIIQHPLGPAVKVDALMHGKNLMD